MRKALFLLTAMAAVVVSCTKDPLAGRSIKVKVTALETKGTVTTTAGLVSSGSFVMDAYIAEEYVDNITDPANPETYDPCKYIDSGGNANVVQNAGNWAISGDPSWVSYTPVRFWAWHPVSLTDGVRYIIGPSSDGSNVKFGADSLAFTYATPDTDGISDATNAVDLIFAHANKTYDEEKTDETVNLTFHHALSEVRFCVSTNDGTFDPSLEISNVTIKNLKTSGFSFFNGLKSEFEWSDLDGDADFGQDYNASFKTLPASGWTAGSYTTGKKTYDLHTCQNVFFMIPQTVKEDAFDDSTNWMEVTFKYNGNTFVKTVPIADNKGVEWLPDHYYTYKINATIVGRDIDASVSLMSWSDRDDTIFI